MTSWRDVPVPPRIGRRPTEARGFPVPYVATSTGEQGTARFRLGDRHDGPLQGLRLVTPGDWTHKRPEATRSGTAVLGRLSEERQRLAMLAPRCQVCGYQLPLRGPWTFIAGAPPSTGGTGGLSGYTVPGTDLLMREPAVCGPCARYALQVCPGLVGGHRKTGDVTVYTVQQWLPLLEVALPPLPGQTDATQALARIEGVRQLALQGKAVAVVYVIAALQVYSYVGRDEWLSQNVDN